MKKTLTLLLSTFCALQLSAQINTSVTTQGTTCFGSQDGAISVDLEACYAPLTVVNDTDTVVINGLNNDEYYGFIHGQGELEDWGVDVWGGTATGQGIVATTGFFSDTLTFDSVELVSNGGRDIFVAVHDTLGNLLWAASAGGATNDEGGGVFVYNDRVYVSGYYSGTAEFGSGNLVAVGPLDGFIAKYSMNGTLLGVASVGTSGSTQLRKLSVYDTAIYAIGNHTGTVDVGSSTVTSANTSTYDQLVVCFDTNLSGVWALNGGGADQDFGYDIELDTMGGTVNHIYVVGEFSGSASFGSGISLTSSGSSDGFIGRVTNNGFWDWGEKAGSPNQDAARGVELSGGADSVFVSGFYSGTVVISSQSATSNGDVDVFVARLDTAGNPGLVSTIGGTASDYSYDLEMIGNGYLVVTGQSNGTIELQHDTLTTQGSFDGFAIKLSRSHTDVWSKSFGGTDEDSFNSVRRGAGDRLHVTGYFQQTGFSAMDSLISAGNRDVVTTNDDIFGTTGTIPFNGLDSGTYNIVTFDNAGNGVIDTVIVPSADSIAIAGAITPASTTSSLDGAIDVTVTGGNPGYTYLWNTTDTTQDLSGIGVGTYTITVVDSNGCVDSATFVIDTTAMPLSVDTAFVTNVDCFGDSTGAIDVVITGGIAPVTYMWSTGAMTQDLSNLLAGTYTVTVADVDSSFVITYTVTQNPAINVTGVVTPPSSGTSNDGAIDLSVSGGIPPYMYMWSNSAATEDIDSLMVGSYTVTVTDSIGCTVIETFAVDTLPALQLFFVALDVTCESSDNGSIDLTVQGGVSPYSYLWSTSDTTEDVNGLAAGTYTVTVTDDAGQTAEGTVTIGSNPTEPDPIVGPFSGSSSVQSWTNYSYTVAATNGSSFQWSAMGGVVVSSVSNSAMIQWDAGPTGMIYVEETSSVGCTAIDSFEVVILFVGVEETHENAIAVFPNPASEVLNIQLPDSFSTATISLSDLQGRTVVQPNVANGTEQIATDHLPSGMYILHIEYPNLHLTHQVVIR